MDVLFFVLLNLEQWKRIAGRAVHASPPLSRQYYQTVISTLELQNGQIPQPLISYRRPGRSENEEDQPTTSNSRSRAPRRRIFIGSSIAVVLVAIVAAVVLAITLGFLHFVILLSIIIFRVFFFKFKKPIKQQQIIILEVFLFVLYLIHYFSIHHRL